MVENLDPVLVIKQGHCFPKCFSLTKEKELMGKKNSFWSSKDKQLIQVTIFFFFEKKVNFFFQELNPEQRKEMITQVTKRVTYKVLKNKKANQYIYKRVKEIVNFSIFLFLSKQ